MHCWILFSLPGSKDHESRDLCCLVLHSSPILPIVPDPEHTLRKIWWINTWSRCALCRGPQWKGILYSSWESCNLCEKEFCLIETMLKAVYLNYSPSLYYPTEKENENSRTSGKKIMPCDITTSHYLENMLMKAYVIRMSQGIRSQEILLSI